MGGLLGPTELVSHTRSRARGGNSGRVVEKAITVVDRHQERYQLVSNLPPRLQAPGKTSKVYLLTLSICEQYATGDVMLQRGAGGVSTPIWKTLQYSFVPIQHQHVDLDQSLRQNLRHVRFNSPFLVLLCYSFHKLHPLSAPLLMSITVFGYPCISIFACLAFPSIPLACSLSSTA